MITLENTLIFHYEMQDFVDAHGLVHNTRLIPISRLLKILAIFIVVFFVIFMGIYLYFNLLSLASSGFISEWTFSGFLEYLLGFKDDYLFLLFLLVPILLMFFIHLMMRFRWWSIIRRNPDLIQGERRFSFGQEGVNWSTPSSASRIEWTHFKHAIEGRKHFILLTSIDNYLIVPKRVFSNPHHEEEFRDSVTNNLGIMRIHA
jgi:hypothetical protein